MSMTARARGILRFMEELPIAVWCGVRTQGSRSWGTAALARCAQGRAEHFWLRTGALGFVSVELAQLFVSRRLDEPEPGNDAPNQCADHENPDSWQEPTGEQGDDSDQPNHCQRDVEDDVVDADDEVFHRAYSLREIKKPPIRGARMLSHCLHSSRKAERTCLMKNRSVTSSNDCWRYVQPQLAYLVCNEACILQRWLCRNAHE